VTFEGHFDDLRSLRAIC